MNDSLFTDKDLDQEEIEKERKSAENSVKEEVRKEEKKVFSKRLYVLDGYSIIYRSYFAHISNPLTDGKGVNISAYFGFFSTLLSLLTSYRMDYLAIAMDEKVPTFRHEMYPEYKATRDKAPEDLHAQVPMIKETLSKMNISTVSNPGFEADDVIASLTRKAEENETETIIVTGDKDLMQLVGGHVSALRPPKKGESQYRIMQEKEVEEEYGVKPSQIVDFLSIIGDKADNVPGIKGLGEKGAAKLLAEYGSLDGIYSHLDSLSRSVRDKLEAGREGAELSKRLIILSREAVGSDFDFEALSAAHIDFSRGADDFVRHGCMTLAKRAGTIVMPSHAAGQVAEKVEYIIEKDLSRVGEDLARAAGSAGMFAISIQAESAKYDARMTGFAYSSEPGRAVYVPVDAWNAGDVRTLLGEYLGTGRISPAVHDAKAAIHALGNMGIGLPSVRLDTMIAAWMIDSGGGWFDLDSVYRRVIEGRDDPPKRAKNTTEESRQLAAAEDADRTLRLAAYLEKAIDEQGFRSLYREMEEPLIRVLADMEREGIHVSMGSIRKMDEELAARIDALTAEIHGLVGHPFNIASTVQMAKVLYDEKGFPRPGGGRSSSVRAEVLQGLLPKGGRLIEAILEYRNCSTLRNTFTKPMQSMADARSRIHTTFLQTGTATGRLSSREPNLQNIPIRTDEGRRIRDAFTPKEGTVFISGDYSQIELVVLAHITQDRWLMEAFRNGLDVHRYTAGMIFSKPLEEVTPAERRIAKTINFGIIYGMSAYGVSSDLGISRSDAAAFRKKYLERYTGIQDFIERTEALAKETGYVTTMHGHRRRIESAAASSRNASAEADRMAVNTVIQGSAAEIVKKAMLSVSSAIRERGMKTRLLLQIHDELIFEVPIEEKEEAAAMIKELMENAEKLSVPLRVSIEEGKCWGAMH